MDEHFVNPDETTEPSPFAAFAVPKRSAVEEYQEQQRRAAAARRTMFGCVLAALVGCTGGATACAAGEADLDGVLSSLVGSLIGSVSGAVLGAIVGTMCFGILNMANARSRGIANDFVRRDPMAAVRGLMFAWSLIGTALGASEGAQAGARWAGVAVAQQPLARWTMIGSLIGGGFGLAVWFFTMRKSATPR